MTLPFTPPGWMPPWLGLVLLLIALLYALALLAMPFAVFGVKSRLEAIEEQLDHVQEELRILTMRLPEPLRGIAMDETPYDPLPRGQGVRYGRDPAPRSVPPSQIPLEPNREPIGRPRPPSPPSRAAAAPVRRIEPRLD